MSINVTQQGSRARRVFMIGAVSVLVVLALVGGYFGLRKAGVVDDKITVTAQFDEGSGLFVGNVVEVLGLPVGAIESVEAKGTYVEVKFNVDKDVKVPANVIAAAFTSSVLTDRHVALSPPYTEGPVLKDGDLIPLDRTRTPVGFDRVLATVDKLAAAMKGDGKGGGPAADLVNIGAQAAAGNGEQVKTALDELSKALKMTTDGAETKDQLTTIIKSVSSLVNAMNENDKAIRQFGSAVHGTADVLAAERFGTGNTGRKANEVLKSTAELIEKNRDVIKGLLGNSNVTLQSLSDNQRELKETLDLLPLLLDNVDRSIDRSGQRVAAPASDAGQAALREPVHQGNLQHDGSAAARMQHRNDGRLRSRLRTDLHARRHGQDGAVMRGSKVSKLRAAALAAVGALAVSACTPPGLDSLPLPAPNMGSQSYKLTARFANALNLPAKAKVRLGGADVGEVESMDAVDYVAVVQLRIREGVRLPVGTTAQLRTATPLGDVFVAVTPPATPSGQLLKDGGTLDLDNTSSAATVEGVLASAAVLVNGGVIRNLTHVVNGLGKSSGGNGSNGIVFGDIVKQSDQLMGTLNGRSAQIQNSLDKTSQLASTLSAREKTINDLLESGAPALKAIDPHQVTDLADTAGHISDQLAKFPSIQGTDSRSMITDFNTVARAFNDVTVSPDTSLVALNRLIPMLIKANAGSALAVDVNMAKLALGNWPDAGYKGDPTFHGPKQADWGYLVGSFKYSLYRLQERVVGQGPNPPAPAPAPQPEPQPAPAPEPGPGR